MRHCGDRVGEEDGETVELVVRACMKRMGNTSVMARLQRSELRDLLGVPVVPPPLLTRLVIRARASLAGARRAAAPPSLRVLEGLFGLFDNRALGLLVELELPEMLQQPRHVAELAATTGTDPQALERVLRYAAGRGFLRQDRRGRYRTNAVTDVLRRDHPNSWRGWVEFAGSECFWDAWRHLDTALRADRHGNRTSGIEAATGHPFFEFVHDVRPEAGRAFDAAMQAGATLQAVALDHALDWAGVGTVCDVGGGTGAVLEYLLSKHPRLKGVLVDLPEVLADARPRLAASGELAHRCTLDPGSFFDEVPASCDRYLLLAVVHDWDDDQAERLLRRVAGALGPNGHALVVENVLSDSPKDEFVATSDLLMLALASGRERTAAQFQSLFQRSGLRLERRIRLASGFVAFELRRASAL